MIVTGTQLVIWIICMVLVTAVALCVGMYVGYVRGFDEGQADREAAELAGLGVMPLEVAHEPRPLPPWETPPTGFIALPDWHADVSETIVDGDIGAEVAAMIARADGVLARLGIEV